MIAAKQQIIEVAVPLHMDKTFHYWCRTTWQTSRCPAGGLCTLCGRKLTGYVLDL
jgi:hypothetical protein